MYQWKAFIKKKEFGHVLDRIVSRQWIST